MSLEQQFNNLPFMHELFWPCSKGISYSIDNPHPMLSLVLGSNSSTKEIAMRTDKCCQLIKNVNPEWLEKKAKFVLSDEDYSNVSALLGEIRAYGELIWVWGKNVQAGNSGNDFSIEIENKIFRIEVNTPQHRTKRYSVEHESFGSDRVKGKIFEIFPFGWPDRNIDNVQGEAVSKISSIKQEEHQLSNDAINVLWVDLKDPVLWCLDFGTENFLSLSAFREEITSGAFWNAFYAKKGTFIYDQLDSKGLSSKIYKMEYNGRFWNNTVLDFVVADTQKNLVIFQNPNRNTDIPNEFYRNIHRFFAFNMELSWLDWPDKGNLSKRVELEIEKIQSYKEAFKIA